eukprot:TRINITY_DN2004_c0_g1_i2.p1 TRINITY_DN2004_c0_g1~~TRINITY_DN2004_c0_g1_i2.p1  ORF type:complete len:136 (+),score=17.46 TRINITY_DN2004_c0_g1_i2:66-473(+)
MENIQNTSTANTIVTLSRLNSIWKCLMITAVILLFSLAAFGSYIFFNQQTVYSGEALPTADYVSANIMYPPEDFLDVRGPMPTTSPIQVDVVYTWVNGSDPEFVKLLRRPNAQKICLFQSDQKQKMQIDLENKIN